MRAVRRPRVPHIHHQADPLTLETELGERTYVIISDEIAGAAGNGFFSCRFPGGLRGAVPTS